MILDEICAHKRGEVVQAKASVPLGELKARAGDQAPPRDFRQAIRTPGISLIAEVKHASPSKGLLVDPWDPRAIARIYEQAGARAISVLTDEKFFKGSSGDFSVVHRDVSLLCLRKDFIVDTYQIHEARAIGADAILLIVRVLSDDELREFRELALSMGMATLVETHCAEEIDRALSSGAQIIGINNRDLSTFDVSIETTLELKKHVPGGIPLVSESGIRTRDHVQTLEDCGIDAILVGESLVTSGMIREKIRELLNLD